MKESCENCRFYQAGSRCECRRYPPRATLVPWPKTLKSDWCGEWERAGQSEPPSPLQPFRADNGCTKMVMTLFPDKAEFHLYGKDYLSEDGYSIRLDREKTKELCDLLNWWVPLEVGR